MAVKIVNAIILKAGTYGFEIFELHEQRVEEHQNKITCIFWKNGVVPQNSRAIKKLLECLSTKDVFDLKHQIYKRRVIISGYLLNGYHNRICTNYNCWMYKNCQSCSCKLWGRRIGTEHYLRECLALHIYPPLQKLLQITNNH